MIKTENLSKELIIELNEPREQMEHKVEKKTLEGIDEIQYLKVAPKTAIKTHGHKDQWEVWVWTSEKKVYVCPKNERHTCVNNSDASIILMAVKGHIDYSYEELEGVFSDLGFSVIKGDLLNLN